MTALESWMTARCDSNIAVTAAPVVRKFVSKLCCAKTGTTNAIVSARLTLAELEVDRFIFAIAGDFESDFVPGGEFREDGLQFFTRVELLSV